MVFFRMEILLCVYTPYYIGYAKCYNVMRP